MQIQGLSPSLPTPSPAGAATPGLFPVLPGAQGCVAADLFKSLLQPAELDEAEPDDDTR